MGYRYFAIPLLVLLNITTGKAQHTWETWTSIKVEKLLSQSVSINVTGEARTAGGIEFVDNYFGEAEIGYDINKYFNISGGYRYEQLRDRKSYRTNHRVNIDFTSDINIFRMKLDYRIRGQKELRNERFFDSRVIPENVLRHRIQVKPDINKRLIPYAYGELFYNIRYINNLPLEKYRLKAGMEYAINLKNEIDLGYLFQKNTDRSNAPNEHVVALSYKFIF